MIGKYLDVSTGHVTKDDMELLEIAAHDSAAELPVIAEYLEGVICYVPDDYDYSIKRMRKAGISESFIKLLAYARKHGCYLIRLDCDGDEIAELDKHDW